MSHPQTDRRADFPVSPVVSASIEWPFTLVLEAARSYGRVMQAIEERLSSGDAAFLEFMGLLSLAEE